MKKKVVINNFIFTYSVLVIGKCFADFTDLPIVELSADVGGNITLPCRKTNESQVMWIRGGKKRNGITDILPNGNLFLSSLQKNDTGIYECVLDTSDNSESDSRNIQSRVHLSVKSPPSALQNVSILPSSVLALLQWSSVEDGGYPISNITLRYKEKSQLNNKTWHEMHPRYSTNMKQIDIYKLNPNTTYLFQIWATNKLGAGEVTTIITRTLYNSQEIELARHLLEGAETFDTRVWIAAVAVVMITLVILTTGVCCVLYHEGRISLQKNEIDDDPEKIELIPNVILNPNYYEEVSKWKKVYENVRQQEEKEKYDYNRFYGNFEKQPVRV